MVMFFILFMLIILLGLLFEWILVVLGLLNFVWIMFGGIGVLILIMVWDNCFVLYYV